ARVRQGRRRHLLLPARAEVQGAVLDARLQRQGAARRRCDVADLLRPRRVDSRSGVGDRRAGEASARLRIRPTERKFAMKALRWLPPPGAALLPRCAPLAARARPPQGVPSSPPPSATAAAPRSGVAQRPVMARVSSLPARARAGRSYVVHAVVVNRRD